jgi:murein DD-endopeptidase MepM/ murein hydrolase activator NlpD
MRIPGKRWTTRLSGRIGFWAAIGTMLSAALFLAACAFFTTGVSTPSLIGSAGKASAVSEIPSGFIVVDISHSLAQETVDPGTVALGIGPIPEGPSLFEKELVLEDSTADEEEAAEDVASSEEELAEEVLAWTDYYVKPGETLSDISASFGIPMKIIQEANNISNPHRISEGQELLIPVDENAVSAVKDEIERRSTADEASRTVDSPLEVKQYTVKDGDSLWSIANSFNLDINTLFGCNTMKDPNYLRVGTVLRIPNQDGIFYKVAKGDTLAEIAKKHGTQTEQIVKANGMDAGSLKDGEEIFLPGAKPVTTVFSLIGSSSGKSSQQFSKTFEWPLSGRINSGYGWRRHPLTKRRDFHTGIDIKGSTGRIIRASKAGRVAYAGWMGGYGRVVVIDHGRSYTTLYAHCSSLMVKQGQRVSTGQPVGKVGSSGQATGPHLHFEVRLNNKAINPLQVLK